MPGRSSAARSDAGCRSAASASSPPSTRSSLASRRRQRPPCVHRAPSLQRLIEGALLRRDLQRDKPPVDAQPHQTVAIERGVDVLMAGNCGLKLPPLLPAFGRALAGILLLQTNDRRLQWRRQPIRLPVRSVAALSEGLHTAVLVVVEDLVPSAKSRIWRRGAPSSRPRAGGRQTGVARP